LKRRKKGIPPPVEESGPIHVCPGKWTHERNMPGFVSNETAARLKRLGKMMAAARNALEICIGTSRYHRPNEEALPGSDWEKRDFTKRAQRN
jgi:hypothetical protein